MANKLQQNRQSQNKTKRKKNVETKQTNRKPHKLSDDDPAMNSPLCPFLCHAPTPFDPLIWFTDAPDMSARPQLYATTTRKRVCEIETWTVKREVEREVCREEGEVGGRSSQSRLVDVFIKPNKPFINILRLTLFWLVHYNNVPRKCARHPDAM